MEPMLHRYQQVQENITLAAQSAGRTSDQVRLVVVTKSHPVEQISILAAGGVCDFGENRAAEALPKIEILAETQGLRWHMVGHIQSRKAQMVSGNFDLVHSVDRVKLANRLNRFSGEAGEILPILLQFNVSGEQTKSGWSAADPASWDGLIPEVEAVLQCEFLKVHGLMTLAPYSIDSEEARPCFVRLRRLRDFLAARFPSQNWNELSMGMSGDYQVAIQEGATIVRIGTAILGSRYDK
jgi:pyridoxal phosphate enzyme (YggS family)